MGIPFTKMSGCGNDFIVIDNRKKTIREEELGPFAQKICKRKVSLGADGLLVLENSSVCDFKMRLFNPDGSEGEMCGNGARCIARFAHLEGIVPREMRIETLAGEIRAEVLDKEVGIKLPDVVYDEINDTGRIVVEGKSYDYTGVFLGVSHCVIFLKENMSEDVLCRLGKAIRFNREHFPKGTNVNFVRIEDDGSLFIRTYERGVEEITLSCGTGSASSAVIASLKGKVKPPVTVKTKGGVLKVCFDRDEWGFRDITLLGNASMIARGELLPEGYGY